MIIPRLIFLAQQGPQQQQAAGKETMFDSMRKCKSFLQTLIKLASQSNQTARTVENVRELIQLLIVRIS